jgi:hypothetical protein
MDKLVREYLDKIVRGQLDETSIRKQASKLLEDYDDFVFYKSTNKNHVSEDYQVIRIVYDEDYQNTELLVVKKVDVERTLKYIKEAHIEYVGEDESNPDETALDLQEKYGHVHNYIEFCLDNHSDIPHTWIMYDELELTSY